jgi:hypothetical protein
MTLAGASHLIVRFWIAPRAHIGLGFSVPKSVPKRVPPTIIWQPTAFHCLLGFRDCAVVQPCMSQVACKNAPPETVQRIVARPLAPSETPLR